MVARLSAALAARGLSAGTACLAGVIVCLSVVGFVAPISQWVGCSPGSFFTRAWTLLTAGLYEGRNVVQAAVHAAAVLACATVLEPLWGGTEWARFLVIADAAGSMTAVASSAVAYSASAAGPAGELLLHTPRYGAAGVVAACLVGVAQAMPDREVTLAQAVKLRMKQVPALYVACMSVGALAVGKGLATLPLLFGGVAGGWTYLRFFQAREGGGRGDASAEFRLASFLPAPVTPVVDAMAGVCDRVVHQVVILAGKGGADGLSPASGPPPLAGLGGGKEDAAAQRRRERGQRALEERLKAKVGTVLKPATTTDEEAVAV